MKRRLFALLTLLNITGYTSTISCNTYLNSVVALGSASSFMYLIKSTLQIIQKHGIFFAIQTTQLQRVMLDLLAVGNMTHTIMQEKNKKDNSEGFFNFLQLNSNTTKDMSLVFKTSMAISLLGEVITFLFWVRGALGYVQERGFTNIIPLRLALYVLTVTATGKAILS